MTGPVDDRSQQLLAELLAGERTESDAGIEALLRSHPELRQEIAAMQALARTLSSGTRSKHDELAAAQAAVSEDDVAQAQRALALHPPQRRAGWRRAWVSVAAAAVLAVAALLAIRMSQRERRDMTLGAGPKQFEVWPEGDNVPGPITKFTWGARTPRGGHWRIVVYAERDGQPARDEVLLDSEAVTPDLEGNSWQLGEQERQRLVGHDAIYWELIPINAGNSADAPYGVSAHLQR